MVAALKVVGGLVLVVVVGWFGYQVYLHLTDVRAADARLEAVWQAWEDDPESLAAAAADPPQRVTPAPLEPFLELGSLPAESYTAAGTTLRVRTTVGTCDVPSYGVDVKATAETVTVLIHPQGTWWPDAGDAWAQVTGDIQGCDGRGVPLDLSVTLSEPLGDRVVIDAVSGSNVLAPSQPAD